MNHDETRNNVENKTADSNNNQLKEKKNKRKRKKEKHKYKDILNIIMNDNKSAKIIRIEEPVIPSKIDKI